MKLIKIDTKEYPITLAMLRERFPNVSFPLELKEVNIFKRGYSIVCPTPKPPHTKYQKVVEGAPAVVAGRWEQQWKVVDLSGGELAKARLDDAKRQAIQTNLPSWNQVEAAIDNLVADDSVKTFLKKLSRVVYLQVKDRVD